MLSNLILIKLLQSAAERSNFKQACTLQDSARGGVRSVCPQHRQHDCLPTRRLHVSGTDPSAEDHRRSSAGLPRSRAKGSSLNAAPLPSRSRRGSRAPELPHPAPDLMHSVALWERLAPFSVTRALVTASPFI